MNELEKAHARIAELESQLAQRFDASHGQAPAQPGQEGEKLQALFREALAWGMTYGPEIPAHQWDEMRESMVKQYTDRAARAAPQPAVPAGWVMVPVAFVQGFNTLAHNYSLRAIPPDCYWGTEGDAFSAAYRRCGEDLAKLRAQLEAIGAAGYSAGDMAAQGAEQFRAGQASMLAAGERKPLDAAQRRALLESVDHYNFPGDLIRATEAAHGIAAQQGDSHE